MTEQESRSGEETKGKLMLMGGEHRHEGDKTILEAFAQTARKGKGPLAIITAATYAPAGTEEYLERFKR